MYTASITVPDHDRHVERAFCAEDKLIADRASYAVQHHDGKTTFSLEAKDAVALRTAFNAITKLMTVHDAL